MQLHICELLWSGLDLSCRHFCVSENCVVVGGLDNMGIWVPSRWSTWSHHEHSWTINWHTAQWIQRHRLNWRCSTFFKTFKANRLKSTLSWVPRDVSGRNWEISTSWRRRSWGQAEGCWPGRAAFFFPGLCNSHLQKGRSHGSKSMVLWGFGDAKSAFLWVPFDRQGSFHRPHNDLTSLTMTWGLSGEPLQEYHSESVQSWTLL